MMNSSTDAPMACLVIGFAEYTIRLFSANLKEHVAFVPIEFSGWNLPQGKLDLEAVTAASLLNDVESARQTAGLRTVAILGFSFGGMIALDYVLSYPSRVSQIVLICSPPCWTTSFKQHRRAFQQRELSPDRAAILRENQQAFDKQLPTIPVGQRFAKYTVVQAPLYWHNPRFDESTYWEGLSVNPDLINHIDSHVYKEHDQTHRFQNIASPILAVLGRHDFATPCDSWDPYRTRLTRLTIHVLNNSAHHPMVEEQVLFDELLLRWLSETRDTGSRK